MCCCFGSCRKSQHLASSGAELSVDAAPKGSLIAGEGVHGSQGKDEAIAGMVNSHDLDGIAVVGEVPAGAALGAAPARNARVGTDVREERKFALGRVAADKTVGSVRAGDVVHGAAGIIVTSVVLD